MSGTTHDHDTAKQNDGWTDLTNAYDPEQGQPLSGYLRSMAVFTGAAALAVLIGRIKGQRVPERFAPLDLVLGGIAAHKFARLLGKGAVTSPLRTPFVRFEKSMGSGEVQESVRRTDAAGHAVGELLSCPFCLAPWIVSAYTAGLIVAPKAARTWAAIFTMTAISDGLQHLYSRLRAD